MSKIEHDKLDKLTSDGKRNGIGHNNITETNKVALKRKKHKKRVTLIGQLQALPPTQVLIKFEHVSEVLASTDSTSFSKLFDVAVQARQVDVVLDVILKMCSSSDKEIPLSFEALSQFSQYFITLGSATATDTLQALLTILSSGKSVRVISFLINRLIASVDILRNLKFRSVVKSSLPSVITGHDYSYLLAESLCYTLLMEASYEDNCDVEKVSKIWAPVAALDNDPIVCLLSLTLDCFSEGNDETLSSNFCNSLANFEKRSYNDNYMCMFLRLLDQHLSSISYLLSSTELRIFSLFLLKHNLNTNGLASFTKSLHSRSDLSAEFYESYYTELFGLLGQECSSFNSQVGDSIAKLKCSSKSSSLAKIVGCCVSDASSSKWTPSEKAVDLIDALCCNDVVELCPNQRFIAIFAMSLITEKEVFDRTLCALHNFLEVESVKSKLTASVLKRVDSSLFSVKSLHKAWLKRESVNGAYMHHLVTLTSWVSLSLFGESAVHTLLKLSLKPSKTSILTFAAAVDVYCELDEFSDSLADTITERLDSVFTESTWSNVKNMNDVDDIERLTFALLPLQRFCRFMHKTQKTFVSFPSSANCLKLAKQICRGKLCGSYRSEPTLQLSYKRIVYCAADFLLFAGYVMNWAKTVIDWEYLITLGRVDTELSKKVVVRATNDEVAALLSALNRVEVKDEDVSLVLTIGRFIAERKSVANLVVDSLDTYVAVMMTESGDLRDKLRFANTIIPLLSGCALEEDFVNLVLGMVGVIEWCEIPDGARLYLVGEVASLMIAVIRSSVGGDRFSVVGVVIGKLINMTHSLKKLSEKDEVMQAEHDRLEHTVASMCHTIVGHKDKFARIAPFVVSECLANDREAALSMHRLLGACDKFSIAMLSSTLPTAKKRCFAHVYPQFANVNKIVV